MAPYFKMVTDVDASEGWVKMTCVSVSSIGMLVMDSNVFSSQHHGEFEILHIPDLVISSNIMDIELAA